MIKKILTSGFFDGFHPGHLEFLKDLDLLGEVHVCVGTDENYFRLRGTHPLYCETDRLKMLTSNRLVTSARISSGEGLLDFLSDVDEIEPNCFAVSTDGDLPEKQRFCEERGIEYIVLNQSAYSRDGSKSCDQLRVPYRICLAGGWLDQPWVSSIHPGPVVVFRIKPTMRFMHRSGLATSTRKTIFRIWSEYLPTGNHSHVAKILFGAENPPGSRYISGSQDAIGLVYPGVSKLEYEGEYWPGTILNCTDGDTLNWLERVVHLVPISPRPHNYDPLVEKNLNTQLIKQLSDAGQLCWDAIQSRSVEMLGNSLTKTWKSWRRILPNTVPANLIPLLESYSDFPGCSLSGCGGGYLIVVSENPVDGEVDIKIF